MASIHPLGTVLAVDGRRYVVVGHRVLTGEGGVALGYLTVPYPLGFVGPESLAEAAPDLVDEVVAEGYLSAAAAEHLASLAALVPDGEAPLRSGLDEESGHTWFGGASSPLLPVGSMVRLSGSDVLVMVMGFEPQLDDERADYLGVAYPQGLVSDAAALAFDASGVAEVVHMGFWDEEAEAGVAAVRRYRAATEDFRQQFEDFVANLTADDIRSYRAEYLFDHMEEEPEPDLFDELDDEPEPDFPEEGGLA